MSLPEINRLEIIMNERREGTVENMLVRAIEEELELEFVLQLFFFWFRLSSRFLHYLPPLSVDYLLSGNLSESEKKKRD